MNNSRRQLIKALPLVALAGVSMKVADIEVEAIEVAPAKRYAFKIDTDNLSQEELNSISQTLKDKGFANCLVISGKVDIYEMQ